MKLVLIGAAVAVLSGTSVLASTFVYVSNADDGDIGMYTLQPDGSLQPGQRFKAEKLVMPMTITPDKRFLIAAVRSKPYQALTYAIDAKSGALSPVGTGPLAESFPYVSLLMFPRGQQRATRSVPRTRAKRAADVEASAGLGSRLLVSSRQP